MLTLDEAVKLINAGRNEEVDEQLSRLLTQLRTLLAYGSERLQLGLEPGLALLQEKLRAA